MSRNEDTAAPKTAGISGAFRAVLTVATAVVCLLLGAAELAAGDSRWSLKTRIGEAELDATFGNRWRKSFDGDHEATSVEVAYALNRFLALQAGYHDLGEYTGFGPPCTEDVEVCIQTAGEVPLALCTEGATDPICGFAAVPLDAEVSGWSLSVVPRWPFNDRFSVYGKLGVIDWGSDVSGLFGTRSTESYSGTDLLTGVGLEYSFPGGFGVLAEYQDLDLGVASTSLGASWRF